MCLRHMIIHVLMPIYTFYLACYITSLRLFDCVNQKKSEFWILKTVVIDQ